MRTPVRLRVLARTLLAVLVIASFVALVEASILRIGFFVGRRAVWWPTNGLILALLLRSGRRRWPLILIGAMFGMEIGILPLHSGLWSGIVNLVENTSGTLFAALMLPRFKRLEDWLQEPRLVFRFVTFAIVLAPLLSATIHFFCLRAAQGGSGPNFVFRSVSDMLGYALFTPLVLALLSKRTYTRTDARTLLKTISLVLAALTITFLVFAQSSYPVSFVLASIILMLTMRLPFGGSVTVINLMAIIATRQTTLGHGPFTLGEGAVLETRVLLLQAFLTLNMIAVFGISVTKLEREVFQEKLKDAYDRMEELATTDPLTGVSNRRRFEESLELEWGRADRKGDLVALLMIDVDHFKSYNDSYGHLAGDDCLCVVAQAIQKLERRTTDLLARYGGEEFVFLLATNSIEGALHIAESVRTAVELLHLQIAHRLERRITVSIGCAAILPGPGLSSKALIAAADEALYRAKRNGRNRVEFEEAARSAVLTISQHA